MPAGAFTAATSTLTSASVARSSASALKRVQATLEATSSTKDSSGEAPWKATARAALLGVDVQDFKVFSSRSFTFEDDAVCIIGPNGAGKSSVIEAIRFVLLRKGDRSVRGLVRRSKPRAASCLVAAHFECAERQVRVSLCRQVRLVGTTGWSSRLWTSAAGGAYREVTEETYSAWIGHTLCWADGDLILPQFGLLEGRSAVQMLEILPSALKQLAAEDSNAPSQGLLKRRPGRRSSRVAPGDDAAHPCRHEDPRCTLCPRRTPGEDTSAPEILGGIGGRRVAAEAWIARRLDEVYRELTREPLDEKMEEWGEGGQASLRRNEDGTFGLWISERRGAAACGFGVPVETLSDGAQDLCALALLMTLPGLLKGLQDTLPPLVMLDEPDARLDKRHTKALWHFLSGPKGPRQCIFTSLDNHYALATVAAIRLAQETVDDLSEEAIAAGQLPRNRSSRAPPDLSP